METFICFPGLRALCAQCHVNIGGVQKLFPPPFEEADLDEIYRSERQRSGNRPWLMVNMISTIDGVTEIDGVSGPLGSAGDKDVFGVIRTLPDIILVGSKTATAEGYNPPSTSVSTKARRLTSGAWPVARIAVVSARLDFDLTLPMFTRQAQRPLVLTTINADPDKLERVNQCADLVQCGVDTVDLGEALIQMGDLGATTVLSEGGPTLNGLLLEAELVDEVFISLAPLMGGGIATGIAKAVESPGVQELKLRHILTEDEYLFLRYARTRVLWVVRPNALWQQKCLPSDQRMSVIDFRDAVHKGTDIPGWLQLPGNRPESVARFDDY